MKKVTVSVLDPLKEAIAALEDGVEYLDINMMGKGHTEATLKAVSDYPYLENVGFKKLVKALEENSTCKKLDLAGNHISGGTGIAKFAKVLAKNTTLESVNLSSNDLTSEDVKHLAVALEANQTLTELALNNNNISNAGAVRLAKALKGNTSLRKLYLNNNNIKDDGAEALASLLSSRRTQLDTVALNFNSIRNRGARGLLQVATDSEQLISLGLSGNKIGKVGIKYVDKLLESRRGLAEGATLRLNIDHNRISPADYEKLESKSVEARTQLVTTLYDEEKIPQSTFNRVTSYISRDRISAFI